MQSSLLHSVLFAALAGGCLGSGQLTYTSEATTPELVVVSPGVQVIADLDEPIFYSNNYYWRNQGGYWYRSQYHTRGWARVEAAPVEIRAIERPAAYIHYHGEARARVSGDRRLNAPAPAPPPRRRCAITVIIAKSSRPHRAETTDTTTATGMIRASARQGRPPPRPRWPVFALAICCGQVQESGRHRDRHGPVQRRCCASASDCHRGRTHVGFRAPQAFSVRGTLRRRSFLFVHLLNVEVVHAGSCETQGKIGNENATRDILPRRAGRSANDRQRPHRR
jgi:hypothetical protein